MAAKFRVGATLENFFNPGAPYTNITVTNITDAYFEIEYLNNGTPANLVFPWASAGNIAVLSD